VSDGNGPTVLVVVVVVLVTEFPAVMGLLLISAILQLRTSGVVVRIRTMVHCSCFTFHVSLFLPFIIVHFFLPLEDLSHQKSHQREVFPIKF